MYISIGDIALFIGFCLVTIVSILSAIVLKKIISLIKKVNTVLDSNKSNIEKTITILPDTVQNLNDAAASFKNTMNKAGLIAGSIDSAATGGAVTISDTTENILEIVNIIGGIARFVKGLFNQKE